MRHAKAGDKLGVLPSHRVALFRNLTLALIEHGRIKTTTRRAKAMRWYAEHVVTLAKRGDLASRRQIVKLLGSTETGKPGHNRIRLALDKVYSDIAPRFKDRNGGYTQIFRLAEPRVGDCAPMCFIQYLPGAEKAKGTEKPSDKEKKATKKAAAPKVEDKPAKEKAVKKEAKAVEDKPVAKTAAPKADKKVAKKKES
jgi:large subunit ribosomal protein L17